MSEYTSTVQLKANISQLERSLKKVQTDLNKIGRNSAAAQGRISTLGTRGANSLKKMGDAARSTAASVKAITTAATLAASAFGAVVTVNASKYEVLRAQLKTMTGSTKEAEKAFKRLKAFADVTPFDFDQSIKGFVKLKALGLVSTISEGEKALKSYGNTAAAMGKSLEQMVEAVADAATGENERLKEFGIKARKQGETTAYTFQGVTTVVKNNSKDIQKYLMDIGNVQFAGAMAEQASGITAALSNLRTNIGIFFSDIGKTSGATEALTQSFNIISSVLGQLGTAFQDSSGTMKSFFETTESNGRTWAQNFSDKVAWNIVDSISLMQFRFAQFRDFLNAVQESISNNLQKIGFSEETSDKYGEIGKYLLGAGAALIVLKPFATLKTAVKGLGAAVKALPKVALGTAGALAGLAKVSDKLKEVNGEAGAGNKGQAGAGSKKTVGLGAGVGSFAALSKNAESLGRKLSKLALPIAAVFGMADAWEGWHKATDDNSDGIISDLERMKSATAEVVEGLSFGLIRVEDTKSYIDGITSGDFVQTLEALGDPTEGLIDWAASANKDLLDWLGYDSSGIQEFIDRDLSLEVAEYLKSAYTDGSATISNWFENTDIISQENKDLISDLVKHLGNTWDTTTSTVSGWFADLGSGDAVPVDGVADTVGEKIGVYLKNAWNNTNNTLDGWFETAVAKGGLAIDKAKTTAEILKQKLQETWANTKLTVESWFEKSKTKGALAIDFLMELPSILKAELGSVWNRVTDDIGEWFTFVMPKFENLGDVLRKKMTDTWNGIVEAFTGGDGTQLEPTGAYQGYGSGGNVQKYAQGGAVFGAGTGTSDSIPAMLSNGEFVIRASQVKKHRALLEAINNGTQGFATGGFVGGNSSVEGALVVSRQVEADQISNSRMLASGVLEDLKLWRQRLSESTEGTYAHTAAQEGLRRAEHKIAEIRNQALEEVTSKYADMQTSMTEATTANTEMAKSAEKAKKSLEQMPNYIDKAFGGVFESAHSFGQALSGGVDNFMRNLGDSFKSFARNQMKGALGAAGSGILHGAFGRGSTTANFLSGILGFATGGHVSGPGTGTSDSILARLSNGEYVVNAQAAAANRGLLDSINYGYSNGGVAGEKGGKKKKGILGDMEDMFIHMFGSAFGKTAAQIAPRENLDRFGLGKGEGKGVFSPASRDFLRATERQSSLVDRLLTTESRKSELQGLSSMQRAQFEKGVRSLDSRGRFRKSDEVLAAITGGRLGTSRGKKEEQMLLDIAAGRRSNWVSSSGKAIGGLTHSFASDDPRMAAVRSAKAQGAAGARSALGGGSQLSLLVNDIGRSLSGGIGLAQDASRRAENILSQSRNVRVGTQIGVGQASWQGGRAVGSIATPSRGSSWRDNFSSGSGSLLTAGQKGFQAQNLAIKKAETNMLKGVGGFKTGGSVYAAGKARKPAKLPKFRNGGSVSVSQGGMSTMPPITVNQTNNITATSDVDFQTKLAQNADLVANMVRREAATRGRRLF